MASISVVLVRPLVQALAHAPAAREAFFRATDLSAEMLADGDARISPAQFCVAWAEALRGTGEPALALQIAEHTPAGAFGVVEYVCRSSATLAEALRHWVRYLRILDDAVEVALVDDGAYGALRVLAESEAPAPASHELCFALVTRHARALLGERFRASAVRFSHTILPSLAPRYEAFFGAHVHGSAPVTELVFPREVLGAALPTGDPNLLSILLPTAEEQRERAVGEALLTDQVRRVLRRALRHDDAQLEPVARALGLTPRSLQRRLRDEGTSFQALRDELRQRLADRYLGEGLSVAEISFLLGFSEPSAFFRAFKRWTGLTPIERRLQHASG